MKISKAVLCTIIYLCLATVALANTHPRLVVNIVVGGMRADYLTKFSKNFSHGGFNRFSNGGTNFEQSHYNFMQTTTPVSLATLSTGTQPSVHGVISNVWIDQTTGRAVSLIEDRGAMGLECDAGVGQYSATKLVAQTVADVLLQNNPQSRAVTIAVEPISAIVAGGRLSNTYWIDNSRSAWATSTAFTQRLPEWVARYNALRYNAQFANYKWIASKPQADYINTQAFDIETGSIAPISAKQAKQAKNRPVTSDYYSRIFTSPCGNDIVFSFARQAIDNERLGADENTDILTIVLDSQRLIGEAYGPESVAIEDAYYQLDKALESFVDYIYTKVNPSEVLFVITSDHGTSNSYDAKLSPNDRFIPHQFVAFVNGFMSAQYGNGEWILGCVDRQLYFNRALIFSKKLDLATIQSQVAAFALQYRGVAQALTSTALQNSAFGGGYAQMMQNGFYPKRSGDILLNLQPGWIEDDSTGQRSNSGSMYGYDTHVPLVLYGWKVPSKRVYRRVDMASVAPTLTRIMGVEAPDGSSESILEEVFTF